MDPLLLKTYMGQSMLALRRHSRSRDSIADLIRRYPRWRASFKPGTRALTDGLPWLGFSVIRLLERYLQPGMRVFEYGSGGSTLFFARCGANVVSVEHNPRWHLQVCAFVKAGQPSACDLRLVEPEDAATPEADSSDPDGYASSDPAYQGKSFGKYAAAIDALPDACLDMVLIDGRARPSCLRHAVRKVRPGGMIVLDNTERENYWAAMKAMPPPFLRRDFFGPCPYVTSFTLATVWQAPGPAQAAALFPKGFAVGGRRRS